MRFSSKSKFKAQTAEQWHLLWTLADGCSSVKKTQAQLKQILAHLHAWHRLLLTWYSTGLSGNPELPAPGFNWRQTPELNRQFDKEFSDVPMRSIRRRLKLSHGRVMKLVENLNNDEFLKPGHFPWTGKLGLVSYVGPNTFSHYRWAIKN